MKGMLFISFLDLVENQYGQGVVDSVLAEVALRMAVYIPLQGTMTTPNWLPW